MSNFSIREDSAREFLLKESLRPKAKEEVYAIASNIYESGLKFELRCAALVVMGYSALEESDNSKILKVSGLLKEMVPYVSLDHYVKGIRDDPRQVYLSLNTLSWQIDVFLNQDPCSSFNKIYSFIEKGLVKATYSQNVSRSMLFYSYRLFSEGRFGEFNSLVDSLYFHISKSFSALKDEKILGLSHYGDLVRSTRCVQIAIAGRDCVRSRGRVRKELWSVDKVLSSSHRLKRPSDQFIKNCTIYLNAKSR